MSSEGSGSSVLFRRSVSGAGQPRLDKRAIRQFARRLALELAQGGEFVCLLTTDKELQRLNREFLGQDYPTDVLSFPAPDASLGLGELAISVDRARVQAAERGHSMLEEIQILMLHGVLHLLGMDHEHDRGKMARAEKEWRSRFGLPAGLIERARA